MINYTFTYANLEYFLCILVRIATFMYVAPFFSQKGIPSRVKIGLSFFISIMIYNSIPEKETLVYNTLLGYSLIVMKEAVTGFLVGYSASICNTIMDFSGKIMDMETGLSMANLLDPTTGEMASISGVIYQYGIMLMLIISGMHRYVLQALAETFKIIPVNGAIFSRGNVMTAMLTFMRDYITIGFRICLPVFSVMIILNAVLGIMTKLAPQMNMFSVGMQIKVLVGLCVLFLTAGMMPSVSNFIAQEMKTMMTLFVNAMS